MLELEPQHRPAVFQLAHSTGEREVEQLGQLGPDLARLAVDRIAAEQDEVIGSSSTQRRRQRLCRGERVGAGECVVAQVQALVGPPRHCLTQDIVGAGWSERHHGAAATGITRQLHAFGHRTAAVRVHLDDHPGAYEPPVFQTERFGERDLLGQRGDAQVIAG